MRRYWKLHLAAIGLSAVAGCNVFIDFFGLFPPETGASDLIAFQSEKELVDYFKAQVVARNTPTFTFDRIALEGSAPVDAIAVDGVANTADAGGSTGNADAAPPQAGADSSGGDSFSGTTTQEVGVDESDVIKTDGTYVYMIDSSSNGESVLRITRVFPADQMAIVSETMIEGFGRDIYLHNGKVVAMTSAGGFYATPLPFDGGIPVDVNIAVGVGVDGTATTELAPGQTDKPSPPPFGVGDSGFVRPYTAVTILDVSDPAAPDALSTTRFEGSVSSSRMIDGVLHLVLSNFQSYYVDVLPVLNTGVVGVSDVADVTVSQVVPDFQQEKHGAVDQGEILSWESMFRPTDPDGYGIVTVVSLDADNDATFRAVAVVAQPGLIYASTQAMYLTDTQWDFRGQTRTTTDIYKFAVENRGVTPVATGSVPGRILNQYSMGEHLGNLRVATTIDREFTFNGQSIDSQNNVYVLAQESGVDGLSIIGRVEGIAPGESIQSARFLGDRGYLVTFLQIDPLFTLDLVDPRNPKVVGELKVPGFSTFLTPIDQDHLLAVGRYIPPAGDFGSRGVQLSIFDVSDFANPTQSANVIIGQESGADSEALRNPKAFTYFPEGGMVALPIEMRGDFVIFEGTLDGTGEPAVPPAQDVGVAIIDVVDLVLDNFRGVMVFDVSVESGLKERGRISTRFDDAAFNYPSFARGLFIDDRVYAVTNIGIRSAGVADVNNSDQSLTFDTTTPTTPTDPTAPSDPVIILKP